MFQHFGNKSFVIFKAEIFQRYPINKALEAEESEFLKPVKIISIEEVPSDENIVNSHVLYEKKKEDGSFETRI